MATDSGGATARWPGADRPVVDPAMLVDGERLPLAGKLNDSMPANWLATYTLPAVSMSIPSGNDRPVEDPAIRRSGSTLPNKVAEYSVMELS